MDSTLNPLANEFVPQYIPPPPPRDIRVVPVGLIHQHKEKLNMEEQFKLRQEYIRQEKLRRSLQKQARLMDFHSEPTPRSPTPTPSPPQSPPPSTTPQSQPHRSIYSVRKAGVIVYDNVHHKVLTISNHHDENIAFPKGSIEPGEEVIDAAIRELMEETGLHLTPEEFNLYHTKMHRLRHKGSSVAFYVLSIPNASEIYTEFVPQTSETIYYVKWRSLRDLKDNLAHVNYTISDRIQKRNHKLNSYVYEIFNNTKNHKKSKKKGGKRIKRKTRKMR